MEPGSAQPEAWPCVDGGREGAAGAHPRGTRHGGGVQGSAASSLAGCPPGADPAVLCWKSLPGDVVLRVVTVVWTSTPQLSTPWAGERTSTVWLSLEFMEVGKHSTSTSSEATRKELKAA